MFRQKNIFDIGMKWDLKNILLFSMVMVLPNFLGLLNVSTPYGFKIHFFQLAIFMAALIYGPIGGLVAGGVGSVYSAFLVSNPYLVIGNMLLGFFVGLFVKYGFNVILSVLLAFLIQLPWLVLTDFYLIHMPLKVIGMLVVALLVSNIIWAFVANYTYKPLKKLCLK